MPPLNPADCLPTDAGSATLIGRLHDPVDAKGPCVFVVRENHAVDITHHAGTTSSLLEHDDPAAWLRRLEGGRRWPLESLIADSLAGRDDRPRLLSPFDLQALKACGVTFVGSMLERVIEERAAGNPELAASIRDRIGAVVGDSIRNIRPGSPEAAEVKRVLQEQNLWSQYLEVGLGPDAEVFTKAPVMSSRGHGQDIGILAQSRWNNPEPELTLAVDSQGRIKGASLGNDVNLRDIEGRSALLLGKAKDNNGSCALGPFIRLLDRKFTLDILRSLEIELEVIGEDGFEMQGRSSLSEISRDPVELVEQTMGSHHQYPDGLALMTGTLFAPTTDRNGPGQGFTHKLGDRVSIRSDHLGTLTNTVRTSESLAPWTFGIRALWRNLAERGLSC